MAGLGQVFLSYDANNIALRDNDTFSSGVYARFVTQLFGGRTILEMVGTEHRQQRALAQSAFTPGRAKWWIERWIAQLVDDAVSAFETAGQAELNSELCSRIPLLTITSSFGLTTDEALDFREGAEGGSRDPEQMAARQARTETMLRRVITDRRSNPGDDLITMLVQAEFEEDGQKQLMADDDIYAFARLVRTAGVRDDVASAGYPSGRAPQGPGPAGGRPRGSQSASGNGGGGGPVGAHRSDLPAADHEGR